MGAALLDDPGVLEAVRGPSIHTEPIRVKLKGFEGDFEAVRITENQPPDPARPSTSSGCAEVTSLMLSLSNCYLTSAVCSTSSMRKPMRAPKWYVRL